MKDAILDDLRVSGELKVNEILTGIKGRIPSLTNSQLGYLAVQLEICSAHGSYNVLRLTPQQFNQVRIKHG